MRNFFHSSEGSVAIEAAFALPFLILIGLGAVDYSNMLLSHHKMQSGLTGAGNYLARTRAPQNFETQAKNLAVTGQMAGGTAILPGWSASDISISYKNEANTSGNYRGADNVQVVQISTALTYTGFGIVNAITPGHVVMRDTFEVRVDGGGA